MESLTAYRIPVKGLRVGHYQYQYTIGKDFFSNFEGSPIQDADIHVELGLEKRPDLYALDFEIKGSVKSDCDRCLASIDLPIQNREQLLVKLSLEEDSEEPEVVYVDPEISHLDVSRFIYEYSCLAIPMIRVYNCEDEEVRPCNEEMLGYLDGKEQEEKGENPIWDELKKFKGK